MTTPANLLRRAAVEMREDITRATRGVEPNREEATLLAVAEMLDATATAWDASVAANIWFPSGRADAALAVARAYAGDSR